MALLVKPKQTPVGAGSRSSKGLPSQTLASVESLSVPLFQEVVLSADIQCPECERRIADMMSKMLETESVVIHVFEKKIALTGRHSSPAKQTSLQLTSTFHGRLPKMATIKRILRSSFG